MSIKKTLIRLGLSGILSMAGCESKPTKIQDRYIDLNNDGIMDIITSIVDPNNKKFGHVDMAEHLLIVSMSTPEGNYKDHKINYWTKPLEVSFKDINGDGRKDILAITIDPNHKKFGHVNNIEHIVRVNYQREDGSFSKPEVIKRYDNRPTSLR